MRKINIFTLIILFGCFFISSCSDDPSYATLSLPESSHLFDAQGGVHTFSVTVNATDGFIAVWQGEDWGYIKQTANQITVTVNANNDINERSAHIVVTAIDGNSNKIIEVKQKGLDTSEIYFITSPDSIVLLAQETSRTIHVNTNLNDWSIGELPEGVDVISNSKASQFEIKLLANETTDDKVIEVPIISEGKTVFTLKITHQGKQFYLLPYLDLADGNISLAKQFESERGSIEISINAQLFEYTYATNSPLTPEIYYVTEGPGDFAKVSKATMVLNRNIATEEIIQEYLNILQNIGYEYIEYNLDYSYHSLWNEQKHVEVRIFDRTFGISFAYNETKPVEPEYETFKVFPYPTLPWTASNEDVIAYEREHNGELRAKNTGEDGVTTSVYVTEGTEENNYLFVRGYGFDKEKLIVTTQHFGDVTLGFYQDDRGKYVVTKKFKELLAEHGFVFIDTNYDYLTQTTQHLYGNQEKQLYMIFWQQHLYGGTGLTIQYIRNEESK